MIFPGWWFQTCLFLSIPGEIIQFDYVIFFKRFFLSGGFFNCHLKHGIRWSVLLGQQVEDSPLQSRCNVAKKKGGRGVGCVMSKEKRLYTLVVCSEAKLPFLP